MKIQKFIEKLKELDACGPAIGWAETKSSWEEVYDTCPQGDWLLWLFAKTNPEEKRLITLIAGKCAETVKHLMKDARSIKAVEGAIAYGEGKIDKEELKGLAYTAAADAAAAVALTAAAADYTADAAVAADAAEAAADKKENQRKTADVVREYTPFEKFKL